jgi:DNA-binding NarL/FixJ family response regulator
LTEIKNKKIKTPVFVLSNLSQEEDEAKALSLGAKAFFVKSGTPLAEIIDKVQKFLAS